MYPAPTFVDFSAPDRVVLIYRTRVDDFPGKRRAGVMIKRELALTRACPARSPYRCGCLHIFQYFDAALGVAAGDDSQDDVLNARHIDMIVHHHGQRSYRCRRRTGGDHPCLEWPSTEY